MKTIDIPLGQSTLVVSQTVQTPASTTNNPETFEDYERILVELQKI